MVSNKHVPSLTTLRSRAYCSDAIVPRVKLPVSKKWLSCFVEQCNAKRRIRLTVQLHHRKRCRAHRIGRDQPLHWVSRSMRSTCKLRANPLRTGSNLRDTLLIFISNTLCNHFRAGNIACTKSVLNTIKKLPQAFNAIRREIGALMIDLSAKLMCIPRK